MSTFTFTSAFSTDDIVAAYGDLDASGKGKARAAIGAAIVAAVAASDLDEAQRLVAIQEALKARVSVPTGPDYVAAIRDLRADLVAALASVDAGTVTLPEGVEVDLTDVDLTGGTVDPKRVGRFVTVAGRKSGRGSVDQYIYEALGRVSGPATITQLAGAWAATSDYPKSGPSTGALGAAIKRGSDERWAACEVDGKAGAELV